MTENPSIQQHHPPLGKASASSGRTFAAGGWQRPILEVCAALSIAFCTIFPLHADSERNISKLADVPDWSELDRYQGTITREAFELELLTNYGENAEAPAKFIKILEDHAEIVKDFKRPDEVYELRFSQTPAESVPRYWRTVDELPPLTDPAKPLAGMRIAIDPGHIGGLWAQMEERWFKIPVKPAEPEGETSEPQPAKVDTTFPVKEGEIVMRTSTILEGNLTKLGARVALLRRENRPVNPKRPEDYVDLARKWGNFPADADPATNKSLRTYSEILFYRTDEIRARADRINAQFKPDLALCLHVNAEGWGEPDNPAFVDANHFHILINGCYSAGEIAYDDQRFEMLRRLLQRAHPEELAVATTAGDVMAKRTGLPPYVYLRSNAKRINDNPYIWSRNLLATRVYECPLVFFEPYVMNNKLTYDRVQAGEYAGTREFGGKQRANIYQEYADAVTAGVANYYREHRKKADG